MFGSFCHVFQVGSSVYVSGQVPLVPGSMKTLPSGFAAQCHYALDHVLSVAKSMGVSMEQAVTAHCYLIREEDVEVALKVAAQKGVSDAVRVNTCCHRVDISLLVEDKF